MSYDVGRSKRDNRKDRESLEDQDPSGIGTAQSKYISAIAIIFFLFHFLFFGQIQSKE